MAIETSNGILWISQDLLVLKDSCVPPYEASQFPGKLLGRLSRPGLQLDSRPGHVSTVKDWQALQCIGILEAALLELCAEAIIVTDVPIPTAITLQTNLYVQQSCSPC